MHFKLSYAKSQIFIAIITCPPEEFDWGRQELMKYPTNLKDKFLCDTRT